MRYFIATNLPFLSKTIKNHVKKTIKYINKLKSNIYHKLLVTNLLNRASVNKKIVEIPKIIEKKPVIKLKMLMKLIQLKSIQQEKLID